MSYLRFPSLDHLRVLNISAANVQPNKVTQANDQLATARTRWGEALAKNTADQTTGNKQVGSAYNRINVQTRARTSDVLVNKVDATNAQSNEVIQANSQKAHSSTWSVDPALNNVWQRASNYQVGSAYNSININA